MTDRRPRRRRPALAAGVAGLLGMAVLSVAGPAPSYDGRGRVVAVDPGRRTVVLDHAPVPGLLPGARSEFPVEGPEVLRGVRPGDRVRFALAATEGTHGLLTVATLAPEPAAGLSGGSLALGLALLVLGLLLVAAVAAGGLALWRELRTLQRRVVALDHEAGMLRRLAGETQDGVRQMAHALDQVAATLLGGYVQDLRRRIAPGAPGAETAGGRPGAGAGPAVVIVQRGRTEVFRGAQSGAVAPGVRVIWDRRRGDRRTSRRAVALDRRRSDRRGAPPESWTRLGFLLVAAGEDAAVGRADRPLRAVGGDRDAPR